MRGLLCLASMSLLLGSAGLSQERRPGPVQTSELGREKSEPGGRSAADLKQS